MDKKTIIIIILSILLCISLAVSGVLTYVFVKNQNIIAKEQVNLKITSFRNLFTENILLSDKEIDFNTRMTLENAVRGLNDSEIFNQWQKFTQSTTKADATAQAKALLELLIQKTLN